MGKYHRTYLNKFNTIVSDNEANTAQNQVTEIWYGYNELTDKITYSRALINFDAQEIRDIYDKYDLSGNTTVKHTLNLYNTNFNQAQPLGSIRGDGKKRAQDFTLELYEITESWHEGLGYNFPFPLNEALFTPKLSNTIKEPSNWFKRDTLNEWETQGAIYKPCWLWGDTGTTFQDISSTTFYQLCQPVIGSQHFDLGSENLQIDITDYVESRINNTSYSDNGLLIRYSDDYEFIESNPYLNVVLFFTNKADSFYVPFIETSWEGVIRDERNNFKLDKENALLLFIEKNGVLVKPETPPSAVTITSDGGDIVSTITGDSITKVTKGVYRVSLELCASEHYSDVVYTDTWEGVTLNNKKRTYTNSFQLLENESSFTDIANSKYVYQVNGLYEGEKLYRGEERRINIKAYKKNYSLKKRPYYDLNPYYRVYIREGITEVDIIPFTEMDLIGDYFTFILDTSWMIPNPYHIDFAVNNEGTHGLRKEIISFEVIPTKYEHQLT